MLGPWLVTKAAANRDTAKFAVVTLPCALYFVVFRSSNFLIITPGFSMCCAALVVV